MSESFGLPPQAGAAPLVEPQLQPRPPRRHVPARQRQVSEAFPAWPGSSRRSSVVGGGRIHQAARTSCTNLTSPTSKRMNAVNVARIVALANATKKGNVAPTLQAAPPFWDGARQLPITFLRAAHQVSSCPPVRSRSIENRRSRRRPAEANLASFAPAKRAFFSDCKLFPRRFMGPRTATLCC